MNYIVHHSYLHVGAWRFLSNHRLQPPSQYQLADTPTSVFIRDFPLISGTVYIQCQLVLAQDCC